MSKVSVKSGWSLALLALSLGSALSVVYLKDLNRRWFVAYQTWEQRYEQAQVEHGRLLLEQSTYAQQTRIEKLAKTRLDMRLPETTHELNVHAQR